MAFKIQIDGKINMAGSDKGALERLSWKEYATEKEASDAVDALAANWHDPAAVWDIVSVTEA
jgi:hypothetical protein